MLRRIHVAVLPGVLLLSACGSVRLYHAAQDDAAKKAQAAYVAADLKNAMVAERTALQAFAVREQDAVQRNQLSLRDANLVAFLSATQEQYGWDAIESEINKRYEVLTKENYSEIETQLRQSDDAHAKLGPLISIHLAATNGKVRLQCTDPFPASQIPAAGTPEAATFAPFKQACDAYLNANRELLDLEASGGDLQKITTNIGAIEKAQAALTNELAKANTAYQAALKNVPPTPVEQGDISALAKKLQAEFDGLDISKTVNADSIKVLQDDPVLAHLVDIGHLQQIVEAQGAIDGALQALQGQTPSSASPIMKRLSALSVWDTAISAKPSPAVGALVMQAEFLRLEAKSVEQRINRGKQKIALLQKKRDAMLDEIVFLNEASKEIKSFTSKCTRNRDLYQSFRGASPNCRMYLARGLAGYMNAVTFGKTQEELIDYQMIEQGHDAVLDDSEIALAQTDGLIGPSMERIATGFAGGIKPEDLSNLINALGLSAIAARVK